MTVASFTSARAAQAADSSPNPRIRALARHAAVCASLFAVSFKQAAGQLVPDTKLDLVVDPATFLHRALHMWEPLGQFGQVQNQAYGYLFPMGPFFLATHLMDIPGWVAQRLWWGTILCLAYLGASRLAARLGIGTPYTQIVTGLIYALSPRMLSTLGPISVEVLPMALAPWVLLPLVSGSYRAPPRRSAARSGIAVAAVGGVNAAAAAAVLPMAVLWLLTRERSRRRTQLIIWWLFAVVLATVWWLVPLLLLGRYSPPFLDFIESASVTTSTTSLVEVLRGTSHWIPYVSTSDGPVWPAGALLVSNGGLVLDTVAVAAAGIFGLTRRDLPHRTWLWSCFCVGVTLVTLGHVASVDGFFSADIRDLLDGVLAPLRNLHKFDPVLRLPLALAAGHLLSALTHPAHRTNADRWRGLFVRATVGVVIVGIAAPALLLRLPSASYNEIPAYWSSAAAWLNSHAAGGRTLLLPGSSFPDYYWGSTGDEPAQPLLKVPWAVRNAIPLAPPQTIRLLDAVEEQLAGGQGSAGLAEVLRRSGVRYLLVRNDLDYSRAGSTRPVLVHQALARSPGISQVKAFGGRVGGGNFPGNLVDQDLDVPFRAVEIYEVSGQPGRVSAYWLSDAVTVSGASESLLSLADRGWIQGRPTVLTRDGGLPGGRTLVTDTPRLRDVFFGRLHENRSPTLAASDRRVRNTPESDYLEASDSQLTVPTQLSGVGTLSAASSASDANATGGAQPDHEPFAALDGDPDTSWWSDPGVAIAQARLSLSFTRPRSLGDIRLSLDASAPGPAVKHVLLSSDDESRVFPVDSTGHVAASLHGTSKFLSVRPMAAKNAGSLPGAFGIRELDISGLRVTRTLKIPVAPGRRQSFAFNVPADRLDSCVTYVERSLCATGIARPGEERSGIDRTFTTPATSNYSVAMTVRARAGGALDSLLRPTMQSAVRVSASSVAVPDPVGGAEAALDNDLGTGWVARPGDKHPRLSLDFGRRVALDGIRLRTDGALAASSPRRVTLVMPHQPDIKATVDSDGWIRWPQVRVDRLSVIVDDVNIATSYDPLNRTRSLLPAGISEVVTSPHAFTAEPPPATIKIACAEGPRVVIGDRSVAMGGQVSSEALQEMTPVQLSPCGERTTVRLTRGKVRLQAASSGPFDVTAVSLVPVGEHQAVADAPPSLSFRSLGPDERDVSVGSRAKPLLLVVHENQNDGWIASIGGRRLKALTIDGWQQGWVVPAGRAGTVELRYGPDRYYRAGLVIGLLALGLLVILAARPGPGATLPAASARAFDARWLLAISLILPAIGGWTGMLAWLLIALSSYLLRDRRRTRSTVLALCGWIAVATYSLAGIALAERPWGSSRYVGNAAWVQILCIVSVAAVCASQLPNADSASDAAGAARAERN
jgi:arabinofuranan 3-O-arabinosyltransferase